MKVAELHLNQKACPSQASAICRNILNNFLTLKWASGAEFQRLASLLYNRHWMKNWKLRHVAEIYGKLSQTVWLDWEQGHHHNGDQATRRPHNPPHDVLNLWTPICNRSRGWAHLIAHIWVPISSTHMIYLLPVSSFLAGSKSVSAHPPARPSDPDTMINTAPEATASSSGKNLPDLFRSIS